MAAGKKTRKLTEAEFNAVFKTVRDDINDLQMHATVLRGVEENLTRYPQIASNFRVFFTALCSSMRTDLIIRLGRIYDPDGTGHESCTLARCLRALRDHPEFISDAAITARLNEAYRNANPEYQSNHRPDLTRIEVDLATIETSRKRLTALRNKVYAHKDLDTLLSDDRTEFLSSHEEVRDLIGQAHDMWNHYSRIWNASTYAGKTINEDDYKWLFEALRRGMKIKSMLDNHQLERMQKRYQKVQLSQPLNDALLADYCAIFLGFGNENAPVWFIGIEEAGGHTVQEVQEGLSEWAKNRKPLEDAPKFYPASGNTAWHGSDAEIQPTWRQLIRMLLLARGEDDTKEAMRDYQCTQLGTTNGQTRLMELLPLACPSTDDKDWHYADWSNLPWLQSRKNYFQEVRAKRERMLRQLVQDHQPKVVIFYGLELPGRISLLPCWSSIAGGRFDQAFEDQKILLWRKTGNTVFFVTRHPVAESDEYFKTIGQFFRENHGELFEAQS